MVPARSAGGPIPGPPAGGEPPAGGRRLALDAALVVACIGLALWIHRRVLAGYFTNDDFVYLERARGLLPQPSILLWRFLSGPAYFGAARTWFGLDPFRDRARRLAEPALPGAAGGGRAGPGTAPAVPGAGFGGVRGPLDGGLPRLRPVRHRRRRRDQGPVSYTHLTLPTN